MSSLPRLELDKTKLSQIRDPLTVSWSDVHVEPGDIMVLHCGDDNYKPTKGPITAMLRGNKDNRNNGRIWTKSSMLDAATIAQARATSYKHGGTTSSSWFIPNFPVTIYDTCQFVLYRNDYDQYVVEKGIEPDAFAAGRMLQNNNRSTQLNLSPVAISNPLNGCRELRHHCFGSVTESQMKLSWHVLQSTQVQEVRDCHG